MPPAWLAVRECSLATASAAATGAAALVFLAATDTDSAASLATLLCALPAGRSLPLLVLQPVETADADVGRAMAELLRVREAVAGAGGAVGVWRTVPIPSDTSAEPVLPFCLAWLVSVAPPPPSLAPASAADVTESAHAAAMAVLMTAQPPPSPTTCIAAANAALAAAAATVVEALASLPDARAWPPPEAPDWLGLPPPSWRPASAIAAVQAACAAAAVPAWAEEEEDSTAPDAASLARFAATLRLAPAPDLPPTWPAALAPLLLRHAARCDRQPLHLPPLAWVSAAANAAAASVLADATRAGVVGKRKRAPHAAAEPALQRQGSPSPPPAPRSPPPAASPVSAWAAERAAWGAATDALVGAVHGGLGASAGSLAASAAEERAAAAALEAQLRAWTVGS